MQRINGDFIFASRGWATYADAAGTTPVDGTGGSPSILLINNTTTPLLDGSDGEISKDAADRQGEGISYDFIIDRAMTIETISISFYYKHTTNYASSDIGVFIYDIAGTTIINPSTINIAAVTPGDISKFTATFTPTANLNYRLIFHIRTTNALAYDFYIDAVSVFVAASAIDSTAIHTDGSAEISGITEKEIPIAADLIVIEDSAASNVKKKVKMGNMYLAGGAMECNLITITEDITIPTGYNALSAGPVTIDDGVTVTVPDGSVWTIV